jgi:alpha-tubulin suppressor-like RCC1 family protein
MNLRRLISMGLVAGVFGALCAAMVAPTPASAAPISFTKISAGYEHTCAISSGGAVYCWGENGFGQLGNDTTNDSSTPVLANGITSGATAITAGGSHSCAIVNGGARCWGLNGWGQLGIEFGTIPIAPGQVSGLTANVSSISAGERHTCAVQSSALLCWGSNWDGQLGIPGSGNRDTPGVVPGEESGVLSVSAGASHTCARILISDARCWGDNFQGQLGNNTYNDSSFPVTPVGLTSGVTGVSAGFQHSCAMVNNGAQCWGNAMGGALGVQFAVVSVPTPQQVLGLTSGVTDISTGYLNSCAVVSGSAKCWGFNGEGAVGDGTTTNRNTPVQVSGLTTGVTDITINGSNLRTHACAIANGNIFCWGSNQSGQLGIGSPVAEFLTPQQVFVDNGQNFVAVPAPVRMLDTRLTTVIDSGTIRDLTVAGQFGVPANATAVALNIAAVSPRGAGHLRIFPTGTPTPNASVLNFGAGKNTPNHVIVKLGAGGQISTYAGNTTDVIIDLAGYFVNDTAGAGGTPTVGDRYTQVTNPRRILTQTLPGAVAGNPAASSVDVSVAGSGGIPSAGGVARVVAINIGALNPVGTGHLRVFPTGTALPNASTHNFVAGDSRTNLVMVRTSTNGRVTVYNASSGPVTVTVDTVGYFGATGLGLTPVDPVRPLDTRMPAGAAPIAPGAFVEVQIRGFNGVVPNNTDVKSVIVNVAAVNPSASGSVNVGPSGSNAALASFTHPANENVANLVIARIGNDGKIRLHNNSAGTTHLIVDITGYFAE